MNTNNQQYVIAVPISSIDEIEPFLKAGADEVYFGIMTDKWKIIYGDAEFISRRQNEFAHISSFRQLSSIVQLTSEYNAKATLVLNAHYSEKQMPYVLEIVSEWENRGGNAVMVSDLGILVSLNEQKSRLNRHLSVMAGVFNHESVAFFSQLNVSRIVLPREMKLYEMFGLVRNSSDAVTFEVITMFQKCQYIDSFCNFIHVDEFGSFPLKRNQHSPDTLPMCHGCVLPFYFHETRVIPLQKDESNTPYCAACKYAVMMKNGIRHFKIAGRGYSPELILKAVRFTKKTLDLFLNFEDKIKEEYILNFGHSCGGKFCYYSYE
jgi:collagenase-like PrtC family protease